MKKIIFVLSALSIILLFAFAKKHSSSVSKSIEKRGTCSTPTNLTATRNGNYVTLNWQSDPVTCSYGGYFNNADGTTTNFGGPTYTWPITIYDSKTPISIHYSVTANCNDGSYSYSNAVFIYF